MTRVGTVYKAVGADLSTLAVASSSADYSRNPEHHIRMVRGRLVAPVVSVVVTDGTTSSLQL